MVTAKDLKGGTVKRVRVPLALDSLHLVAATCQDEIHFPAEPNDLGLLNTWTRLLPRSAT